MNARRLLQLCLVVPCLISATLVRAEDPKPDKYTCPFAPTNSAIVSVKEQVKALAVLVMTKPGDENARCAELGKQFQSNSSVYTNILDAMERSRNDGVATPPTPDEVRARVALSDSLSGLFNAGCTLQNGSRFVEGSLALMDSIASGVTAAGYYNPVNFLIGAGISAASRLGLAISNWFKSNPRELDNIKKEMQDESFRERLCTFRSLMYRIDDVDPGKENLERWVERTTELSKAQKGKLSADQYSCLRQADQIVASVADVDKLLKKLNEDASSRTPAQQCDEIRYLIGAQTPSIEAVTRRLGCGVAGAAATQSLRQRDFCARWARYQQASTTVDCLAPEAPETKSFMTLSSFLLANVGAVSLDAANQLRSSTPDLYATYLKDKEASAVLEGELKRLTELRDTQGQNAPTLAQANSMLKEVGSILLNEGFPVYAENHRKEARRAYSAAQDVLKVGRKQDACDHAKRARNEARNIRPRQLAMAQICDTLGAFGDPKPPFADRSRDFNTVTGEENREDGWFGNTKDRFSPLQRECRFKPDPTEVQLKELDARIRDLWSKSCRSDYL